jgi:hypothetical protein
MLATVAAQVCAQSSTTANAKGQDPTDLFFKKGPIPHLELRLSAEELANLKANARSYVRGTLFENEQEVATDVGVKLKGSAGSYREWDDRPGLTVHVGKFIRGQRWKGLEKFHLNNAAQDDTWLNEWLASDLMNRAGVPATRVTHARVTLNGRAVGLYVLKESFDKYFLARHFERPEGNLYDGGFCQDLDVDLERDEGIGPADHADLKGIRAALAMQPAAARAEALDKLVDIKAFTTFMAMELLVGHWDGYTQNRNNYRLYFDAISTKARFLPHGMDQVFGDVHAAVLEMPPISLSSAVMRHPPWRVIFRKRLAEVTKLINPPEPLLARIDAEVARLQSALAAVDPALPSEHAGRVRGLKDRIAQRAEFVAAQVLLPDPKPLALSVGASVVLRTWRKVPETEDAVLNEIKLGGERQLLLGVGKTQPATASWRKVVSLAPGKYRFSAQARVDDVGRLPSGVSGAGLRISGQERTEGLSGSAGWRPLSCEFEVSDVPRDVEFILELVAAKGSAAFNMESLKLRRVN